MSEISDFSLLTSDFSLLTPFIARRDDEAIFSYAASDAGAYSVEGSLKNGRCLGSVNSREQTPRSFYFGDAAFLLLEYFS